MIVAHSIYKILTRWRTSLFSSQQFFEFDRLCFEFYCFIKRRDRFWSEVCFSPSSVHQHAALLPHIFFLIFLRRYLSIKLCVFAFTSSPDTPALHDHSSELHLSLCLRVCVLARWCERSLSSCTLVYNTKHQSWLTVYSAKCWQMVTKISWKSKDAELSNYPSM